MIIQEVCVCDQKKKNLRQPRENLLEGDNCHCPTVHVLSNWLQIYMSGAKNFVISTKIIMTLIASIFHTYNAFSKL